MKKNLILLVLLLSPLFVYAQDFGTPTDTWRGYDHYEGMTIAGRPTHVYAPEQAAEGNPWVMRAMWWDVNTEIDTGLLERGYHVVYMDLGTYQYGCPNAVDRWDSLYDEMTGTYGLADKAVLVSHSRGGLQVYNWALENIEKVQSIFGNAPVCDFRSWPGNFPEHYSWTDLKANYGFASDEEAYAYQGNVVDAYGPLVGSDIPILHIAGTEDTSVLLEENSELLYDRLLAAGGDMRLEVMEGAGHQDAWGQYLASVDYDLTETLDYLTVSQTPEPATMTLLVTAGIAIVSRRRK